MSIIPKHENYETYRADVDELCLDFREAKFLEELIIFSPNPGTWLDDYAGLLSNPLPFLAEDCTPVDKFQQLVKFVAEVDRAKLSSVNPTTLRRWSTGASRPSNGILITLVPELRLAALEAAQRVLELNFSTRQKLTNRGKPEGLSIT